MQIRADPDHWIGSGCACLRWTNPEICLQPVHKKMTYHASAEGLEKEGILITSLLGQQLVLLQTCILEKITLQYRYIKG